MSIKEIPVPEKPVFPVVRKSRLSALTVLFISQYVGLVIKEGEDYKYGTLQKGWTSCDEAAVWLPISVEISG